ncbi:histone acetyltransferase 1 [Mycoemilia scoparia]|uniref:Histone acetyltransferase type B catalytic subunit n=1 Tax=Mycoemilia scoparia TaxID=417184 RepID=A0A9W8A5Q6_9FUNG|nr:histone acetyltransferase 1 [Mycoemilia scoparia]
MNPETVSKWVTNSNNAVRIRLVSGDNPEAIAKAINRLDQNKNGGAPTDHQDDACTDMNSIDLVFYAAGSLKTNLRISFDKKVDDMESTSAVKLKSDNIYNPIREVLSKDIFENVDEFAKTVASDADQFIPAGKKIYEYHLESSEESTFEIYENSFEDPKFKEFHSRVQTFILFFIEGGTFIDTDDDRWRIYTVFEKWDFEGKVGYSFIGYCTMYRFFHWPDKTRARISQFLILPPFQAQGHGSKLYNILRQMILDDNDIIDFAVEDPSEEFDDLRDKNDLRYLFGKNAFEGLEFPVDRQTIAKMQKEYKLSKRQLVRCLEIGLLKSLDKTDPKKFRNYRLSVKRRLFAQNADILSSLSSTECKDKLKETFSSVIDDYHRILNLV